MPGDWVLAQDEGDPESATTIRQVEEVFENQAQVMVLELGDWSIETTPEHPFWVRDRGWTAAGEIEPGDELRSHDGQWIPLDSKHLTDSIVTVYNMRVAEDHTYFVGSPLWGFTVWAHNAYNKPMPKSGTIDPKSVRFSQDSIAGNFKEGGSVLELGANLKAGRVDPSSIPPIRIVVRDRKVFTLDNRRLRAFQEAGIKVPFVRLDAIPKRELFKFTTKNDGVSIIIREATE